MNKKYILAHDVGTGGTKAVVTDLHGRILQTAYRSHHLYYPQEGWVEQKPEELWNAYVSTTREVYTTAGIDTDEIIGVGVSAQMFNLLPVDDHCNPLINMISWLDVRSVKQADRIMDGDTPEFLFRKTGNIPTAKDIIPKILWLKDERPEIWERTTKLLDCKEYIIYRLTGKIAIDFHGASVYFLFDPYEKKWSEQVCRRLGIPIEKLPESYPSTYIIGGVTDKASELTGLKKGTPVVLCAGDVAAAQTGSGSNRDGKVHLCIGTATWIGISSSKFENNPEKPFWALNHIHPEKWVIAGEMETGGGALMWFRDAFCKDETRRAQKEGISLYELIGRMAAGIKPGSSKLLFAPWLSGERAPVLDHYARGAFVGLSLSHNKSHLARAVMEGVAFHLRWISESMESIGYRINEINTIGGGSTSDVWAQIISDITGRPLHIMEYPLEAGAIGTALTVAVGMGKYPSVDTIDDIIRIHKTIEPGKENKNRYDDLYEEFLEIYTALALVYRKLHKSR